MQTDTQEYFTINSFCDAFHISRNHFYKLKKEGKGPKIFNIGNRSLIRKTSADEWAASLEE